MSNEPKALTARERLELRLSQPIPKAKPKPEPEMTEEEKERYRCEVLGIDPWTGRGRKGRWTPLPDKVTSYTELDQRQFDDAERVRVAVARAARQARARALNNPMNLYGEEEGIDDVVRRQDQTR